MLLSLLFISLIIISAIYTSLARPRVRKYPLPRTNEKSNINNTLQRQRDSVRSQRIIGGTVANRDEYPWFVNDTGRSCGGSLISSKHVLTAAHCESAFMSSVIVGALCTRDNNCQQYSEVLNVKSRHIHPEYKFPSSDFMVVELYTESTIDPIPIDQDDLSLTYTSVKNLWAAGTGYTVHDNPISQPNRLHDVKVKYVPQNECKSIYPIHLDDTMLCAADVGKDACQGDSGGPLLDKNTGVLVGLSSWGVGCASEQYPGVYARVSDQWSWIVETVCKDYKINTNNNYQNLDLPDYCESRSPSKNPTDIPTRSNPSSVPSVLPSFTPSLTPSLTPSISPSVNQSLFPSFALSTKNLVLPDKGHTSSAGLIHMRCVLQWTLLYIIGVIIF